MFLSQLILWSVDVCGQVPIDLSQAKEFRLFKRFDLGGQISSLAYNVEFCGVADLNVITTGVSGRGRVTWKTTPLIDTTNIFNWLGIRSPYILVPFDYDGLAPREYINAQGIIWRCSQGESPFPLMPIDTVANDVCSASPAFSGDVDGDGALDVITEIGRNGVTTRVILGGSNAGKGCERVLEVPVVKSANKRNLTRAFYKSSTGEWRLIQEERDSVDRAPRLQMYRVNFTRTSGKPDVTFTSLGRYRGEDVSQIDEPFGQLAVIVDSVNGVDHMLMDHRIGPPGSPWALERFTVTTGEFTSSGETVTGYDFYYDTYNDLGYSLGTSKPVIAIGYLFCAIDNITQPFARWNPKGSGTQPYAGMTAVNDQSGDGKADLVVVGGGTNGTMVVLTLDSASTFVPSDDVPHSSFTVRLVGSVLEISTVHSGSASITITSVDGKVVREMPASVAAEVTTVNLAPFTQHLAAGLYVLRVTFNGSAQTLSFVK